jgi:hypothetical protein
MRPPGVRDGALAPCRSEPIEGRFTRPTEKASRVDRSTTSDVTLPVDDLVRLTKAVRDAGLKAKPEVGIQCAGGTSTIDALEAEGTRDVGRAIQLAKRHLDAGAHMIMIESEGITEQVREWRTDVVARTVAELGLESVMFEAAEPDVFSWYIKNYGIDVIPVRRPQPDRPARGSPGRHLGHPGHLGQDARLPRLRCSRAIRRSFRRKRSTMRAQAPEAEKEPEASIHKRERNGGGDGKVHHRDRPRHAGGP